jgi:hypothetical protein
MENCCSTTVHLPVTSFSGLSFIYGDILFGLWFSVLTAKLSIGSYT